MTAGVWPPGADPPELRALLDGVHAEPEEDAPRLVLADWLDEHDDPRGGLLRLVPHVEYNVQDWLGVYQAGWPGPTPQGWAVRRVYRGLLCLDAGDPLRLNLTPAWREAVRAGWVETVTSASGTDEVRPLARRLEWHFPRGSVFGGQLDLTGWARLHTLKLAWQYGAFDVTAAGRIVLPGGLRVLDLSETPGLTAVALRALRLPGGLRSVSLAGCPDLAGDGLSALSHLAGLLHLNLERCTAVGEEAGPESALAPLEGLSGLRTLDLRGCWRVGDASVRTLAGLPGLRSLNLRGCWRVSTRAVTDLRKALPRCRVAR